MTCDCKIEQLWRFGGLVRRRRIYKSGYVQEILDWRDESLRLTWTGGERLRFVGEVRSGRWRAGVIVAGVAMLGIIILLGGGR